MPFVTNTLLPWQRFNPSSTVPCIVTLVPPLLNGPVTLTEEQPLPTSSTWISGTLLSGSVTEDKLQDNEETTGVGGRGRSQRIR